MRKSAQSESNSLKAFFAYGGIVLFFILASLLVKAIFVIQESRFDGKHQFILNLYQNSEIKETIKFNPQENKIFVVQGKNSNVDIIPDAKLNANFEIPLGTDVAELMKTIGFKYNHVKTDLTLYDVFRLMFFSYKASVELVKEIPANNFFVDESISSENATIQIVNASGISGAGKKLENALNNLGCNIVEVITAREEEKLSRIQYSGNKSYTVNKLEKLLNFSSEEVDKTKIADVVIIIGKDK